MKPTTRTLSRWEIAFLILVVPAAILVPSTSEFIGAVLKRWGAEGAAWAQAIATTVAVAIAVWVPHRMASLERDEREKRALIAACSIAIGLMPELIEVRRNLSKILQNPKIKLDRNGRFEGARPLDAERGLGKSSIETYCENTPALRSARMQAGALGPAAKPVLRALRALSQVQQAVRELEVAGRMAEADAQKRFDAMLESARAAVSAINDAGTALDDLFPEIER